MMLLALLVSRSGLESGTVPLPRYSCSLMHAMLTKVNSIETHRAILNFLASLLFLLLVHPNPCVHIYPFAA